MRPLLTETELTSFRADLCLVAERLFADHGVEGVTMRQIAAGLGYSATAAYRYFKNKDEILAAVRANAFNRFSEFLEVAGKGMDARNKARQVGRAYVSFALQNPAAYRMMFDVKQADMQSYPDLAAAFARADATMSEYLRELIAAGVIRGDAKLLGQMLWAATHGLVMLRLSGVIANDESLELLHERSMSALVRGSQRTTIKTAESGESRLKLVGPRRKPSPAKKSAG